MLWLAARPGIVTGDGVVPGAGSRVVVGVVSGTELTARPLAGRGLVSVDAVVVVA
jgi:hypothetical protein